MKSTKLDQGRRATVASKVILTKGILNTLLGTVHILGAFTFERANIIGQGTAEMQRDYIVWFFGVGVFILFMGLVDIACYQGLKARVGWAWRMSLLCAAFTTFMGLSGVAVFGASPPVQLLVTGIVGVIALLVSRKEFPASVS